MKLSGLVLIASLLTSLALTLVGGYLTIDNLFTPQGNLFEGVVLFSLGIILASVIVISNNIGTTIMLFKDIYTNQLEFQQKMAEMYRDMKSPSLPPSIKDIIKDMGKDGSITITNLNTGETSTTDLGEVNGMSDFSKMIIKSITDAALRRSEDAPVFKNVNKTREQLEEELAKAVSNDDFETAMKIRQQIKKLDSPESEDNEKSE
jgi:hypothetical protein